MSQARMRNRPARRSVSARHWPELEPPAWMSTTAGPLPASRTWGIASMRGRLATRPLPIGYGSGHEARIAARHGDEDRGDDAHQHAERRHGARLAVQPQEVEQRPDRLGGRRIEEQRQAELAHKDGREQDPAGNE